jgi:hypothetical protein
MLAMDHEARRIVVAALASALLVILATVLLADRPDRAAPDRDMPRIEHVTDVQLPTL